MKTPVFSCPFLLALLLPLALLNVTAQEKAKGATKP
ncbi:MAG: hypothetical protein K0Q55_1134, partial [Verrucomicrobia bacterium]|nr:hypothetical protein [Verrucomicrobiota bacterium]